MYQFVELVKLMQSGEPRRNFLKNPRTIPDNVTLDDPFARINIELWISDTSQA